MSPKTPKTRKAAAAAPANDTTATPPSSTIKTDATTLLFRKAVSDFRAEAGDSKVVASIERLFPDGYQEAIQLCGAENGVRYVTRVTGQAHYFPRNARLAKKRTRADDEDDFDGVDTGESAYAEPKLKQPKMERDYENEDEYEEALYFEPTTSNATPSTSKASAKPRKTGAAANAPQQEKRHRVGKMGSTSTAGVKTRGAAAKAREARETAATSNDASPGSKNRRRAGGDREWSADSVEVLSGNLGKLFVKSETPEYMMQASSPSTWASYFGEDQQQAASTSSAQPQRSSHLESMQEVDEQ